MTQQIWNWLNDLPDLYEHHDHDHDDAIQRAEDKAEALNRTSKTCRDAHRTRRKDVQVIDLTGEQTDEDEEGGRERKRKRSRARSRPAERAGAVAMVAGREGTGRKRKKGARGAAGAKRLES